MKIFPIHHFSESRPAGVFADPASGNAVYSTPGVLEVEAKAAPAKPRRFFLSGGLFGNHLKDSPFKPATGVDAGLRDTLPFTRTENPMPAPAENAAAGPVLSALEGLGDYTTTPERTPLIDPIEDQTSIFPGALVVDPSRMTPPSVESIPAHPAAVDHSLSPALTENEVLATPAATPVTHSLPIMTPTDTTHQPVNSGRATAQLTLAFEIASLQLTSSFAPGSVQLKALSNVVSLHLINAHEAENPLAAGISFQIDHVNLDSSLHLKSLLLKPLEESHEMTVPRPGFQVGNVTLAETDEHGLPITVTASTNTAAVAQLFGTFAVVAMDFTPAFEIGSLRLEPISNTVRLRVAPSSLPLAQDLPPAFDLAEVRIGDGSQIAGVRIVPIVASQH